MCLRCAEKWTSVSPCHAVDLPLPRAERHVLKHQHLPFWISVITGNIPVASCALLLRLVLCKQLAHHGPALHLVVEALGTNCIAALNSHRGHRIGVRARQPRRAGSGHSLCP